MANSVFKCPVTGFNVQHELNDNRSPLLDLMNCIVCDRTMKLEKIDPDDGGNDLIQYRCKLCGRIERLRLFRRSRDKAVAGSKLEKPPLG